MPFHVEQQNSELTSIPWPTDTLAKMAVMPHEPSVHSRRRHNLPCVLMRAGTSKGLFLHRKDLPDREADWGPHLISALGSQGGDRSQLDGIGGGTSTTSKVAVVSASNREDADVDWTFVQVAVGKESVDLTGTCGNMVSGVGPFAVQEGLVKPGPGQIKVNHSSRSICCLETEGTVLFI